MKKLVYKLLVISLSACLMTLAGCKKVKDVKITSVQLEALAPQGLTGLNAFLAVGIDNPAFQVRLEDITGALKHSGKVIGRLAMDPFTVYGRSAEIYHLKALLTIGEDATLKDIMLLTDMARLNECVVDISLKAELKSGVSAPIEIKDIPLKKLLERANNEKNL